MSASTAATGESSYNGPVHVLMAAPLSLLTPSDKSTTTETTSIQEQQRLRWELNPRLQNDCLARRTKANGTTTSSTTSSPLHLWTGVHPTEYALVQCCEAIPDETRQEELLANVVLTSLTNPKKGRDAVIAADRKASHIHHQEYPMTGGGCLDMEREVQFVGILAKDCHNMATRSLALAILERTLDTHLWEVEEAKQRSSRSVNAFAAANDDNEDSATKEEDGDQQAEGDDSNKDDVDDEEEEDEDDGDQKTGQKRRSLRLRKQEPKYKRTKRKHESSSSSASGSDDSLSNMNHSSRFDYEKWTRLEQFFAAGGLRILNRWLYEASEDDIVLVAKNPPTASESATAAAAAAATAAAKSKQQQQKPLSKGELTLRASSTRPLILPLLRFLERIPFDRKLVVDSKINKQIKRIEKQVNNILDDFAKNNHAPEDLEDWTTESTTSSATDALDMIKEAVDQIKKSWGEKAKTEKEKFGNPFKILTETIRERLEAVSAFEAGTAPRPDWLEFPDEVANNKEAAMKKKSSHRELAAKERAAEAKMRQSADEDLQRRLREAEQKNRERLAELRERRKESEKNNLSNTIAALDFSSSANGGAGSGTSRVKWKDGMVSKAVRNRKLLEQIFVFDKNRPANPVAKAFLEENDTAASGESTIKVAIATHENTDDAEDSKQEQAITLDGEADEMSDLV